MYKTLDPFDTCSPHTCLTPIGVKVRESALKPDALPSLNPESFGNSHSSGVIGVS